MYGEDRLLDVFKKCARNPAKSLVELVMADIDHFVGKAPRSDDTTLLVIGRPAGALVDALG
jgi:serine phosphatase RsbU (regulator of sigma subunit)